MYESSQAFVLDLLIIVAICGVGSTVARIGEAVGDTRTEGEADGRDSVILTTRASVARYRLPGR